MRKQLGRRGGRGVAAEAAAERARLARAQANLAEAKAALVRGRALDAEAVEKEWTGILAGVRARSLAVPSRCAARLPHLTAHDVATIDGEIRDALTKYVS
jgi:phage terminase Nu1 subunit (DNA packaging protein)